MVIISPNNRYPLIEVIISSKYLYGAKTVAGHNLKARSIKNNNKLELNPIAINQNKSITLGLTQEFITKNKEIAVVTNDE